MLMGIWKVEHSFAAVTVASSRAERATRGAILWWCRCISMGETAKAQQEMLYISGGERLTLESVERGKDRGYIWMIEANSSLPRSYSPPEGD
jgi:hypothetical protein